MKKYYLFIIILLPILVFSQSSSSSEFEFELIFEKTKEDFENIELFYTSQSAITSCNYRIDSLENSPNHVLIKFSGSYSYIGGAKAVFPTIIITEKQNSGNPNIEYDILQTYIVNLKYSPQKRTNENLSVQQKKVGIPVPLNSNLPIVNIYKNEKDETEVKYYSFDELGSSTFDNEKQNFEYDFYRWKKIFSK